MNDDKTTGIPWSKDELDRLLYLRDVKAMSWPPIAEDLGRTKRSCQSRYWDIVNNRRRKALDGVTTIERKIHPSLNTNHYSSLTAMIFGDPLPGRSALDQMKASGSMK